MELRALTFDYMTDSIIVEFDSVVLDKGRNKK